MLSVQLLNVIYINLHKDIVLNKVFYNEVPQKVPLNIGVHLNKNPVSQHNYFATENYAQQLCT